MVKKTKEAKPAREMTKRQLSHHRQEMRRQRIFTLSGIGIVAVVIILVAVGWFIGEYRPAHETVLKVNDTEYSAGYIVDLLRDFREANPEVSVEDNFEGLVTELARNEIIRQGALELGIEVVDAEVDEALAEAGAESSELFVNAVRYQLLMDKIVNDYFQPQVPASQPQVHINAMLLETEAEAVAVREQLVATDNFSALAEERSLDTLSNLYGGDMGWHPSDVLAAMLSSDVPGDYAFGSEPGILSQPRYDADKAKPVGYWLLRVQEREYTDEAQTQGLLLSTLAEAEEVRARLIAGDNITALATEFSQYEESRKHGGELGLVTKGDISAIIDEYIFRPDLEIGEWSQPLRDEEVATTGAWWLIEVLGKEDDRTLSQDDLDYLTQQLANVWLLALLQSQEGNIEDTLSTNPEQVEWILERAARG